MTRNSFTINVLSINASAPTFEGLFQTYNHSSNSSMSVDGSSPPTEMVSVNIPAGVFRTVAALSNSSSIRLSIVRIEASARFLYPDEVTRNFDTSVILSVSFEGVTLQNLSTSDEILITFEKAEVCCICIRVTCCLNEMYQVCCAVLCWTVILAFPSMQTASRIRCVFYDVARNGGCSLHLCT